MSDATDNLESLSNAELRAKCLAQGFPNVPVTDTSRNLLIKKLRNALQSGGSKSPAKPKAARRQTIHSTKVSEPDVADVVSPRPSAVKTRRSLHTTNDTAAIRRPTRNTISKTPEKVVNSSVKRKAIVIQEDSEEEEEDDYEDDEDVVEVPLTQSKVFTTSYQHVLKEEQKEPIHSPREVFIPIQRESSYSPVKNVAPRLSVPTRPLHTTIVEPPTTSNYARSYDTHTTNTTTRRYTTSGYKPQQTTGAFKRSHEYLNSSDDNEGEEESQIEAPYLSDFARRLSRLKAEPLESGVTPHKKEGSMHRETQRYYMTSIGGRRGISQNDSLGESFRQFWIAVDRKYNLRLYLGVIAIILAILFIYIFFLQ